MLYCLRYVHGNPRSFLSHISLTLSASSALAQQDPSSSTFGDTGQSDTISAPITTVTPSALPHITLPKNYTTVRGVHATFVCLAWLLFFPMGSVLIRVLDSPNVVWIHATVQGTGYLLFMIGAGCGIWMARTDGVVSNDMLLLS